MFGPAVPTFGAYISSASRLPHWLPSMVAVIAISMVSA